ncbi:FAD-dependent oxidoreductase [Ruminococcaceae bacterium OttesenSCG-928-L11]|nr:FAD-dependent oxidoreductase [Ruminococcaceae bacterium OttesenSCG-928-L11]
MTDIVIIGAGTAGLTAAIYALRAGKSALILEQETFGGQIALSPNVENYPGIKAISGSELATALLSQAMDLGAEVELGRATEIRDNGTTKTVVTEDGVYECGAVIIATGARHRHLGVEREEELTGAGVSYCAICDGAFFKGKRTAVVGGGSTAVQDALHLSAYCSEVVLIHRRAEFRAEPRELEKLRGRMNIRILTDAVVTGLTGTPFLTGLELRNVLTGETAQLPVDGLFIAVGQVPDNEAYRQVVRLDDTGYIIADESCETGTPGIYAAGDCRTKTVRQLTTAAADGSIAATAACRWLG